MKILYRNGTQERCEERWQESEEEYHLPQTRAVKKLKLDLSPIASSRVLQFQQSHWTSQRVLPSTYREYYASGGATLEASSSGTKSQIKALDRVIVWGVLIDIIPKVINRFYLGNDYAPINTSTYEEKAKDRDNIKPWMTYLISRATPLWLTITTNPIYKRDLKLPTKF
ncbi:hypothetical protein HAX54_041268 [Datura stramonium]|uniref:Uncharacterized protein n=1 Tax=Datura stramonium TaxID=4076 RepID=A0ABS8VNU1_DATST|nr:hypothetical protein [Datura stramonium]